jgi:selenide, water dikinase
VLRRLVGALPIPNDERILCGFENAEDAAVYRLDDARAVVFTTDVITPVVDDPETYGAIAAANALSDIYAMGGTGLMSLSILGTPRDLPEDVLIAIVRGGAELCAKNGAPVLGGHSLEGKDLLFGLAVIGLVHPDEVFLNSRARPGDALVLTKALGTGALTTARKRDRLDDAGLAPCIAGMLHTSADAVAPLRAAGVRCTTDISGFGLLGHAAEVASASKVELVIDAARVSAYPQARELLKAGITTRANPRNLAYAQELGPLSGSVDPLLIDPQTSGGLLGCVPKGAVPTVLKTLHALGYGDAAEIGEVRAGAGLRLL